MTWHRRHAEENGKKWLDWVSSDGTWRAAEGFDEEARLNGYPWTRLIMENGAWRWAGVYKTLASLKRSTEETIEPLPAPGFELDKATPTLFAGITRSEDQA